MSKSNRKSHRDNVPSKGRNYDLMEMFANPNGGGFHKSRKDKRKNNPKNSWQNEEWKICSQQNYVGGIFYFMENDGMNLAL